MVKKLLHSRIKSIIGLFLLSFFLIPTFAFSQTTAITEIESKTGTTTRAFDASSGTQTIAHGLSATPNDVTLIATFSRNNTHTWESHGYYSIDPLSQSVIVLNYQEGTTSPTQDVLYSYSDKSLAIGSDTTSPATLGQFATVSVDSTNITLTWTRNGTTPAGTINIMWIANAHIEEAVSGETVNNYYNPNQLYQDNLFRGILLFLITMFSIVFYFAIKYKKNG